MNKFLNKILKYLLVLLFLAYPMDIIVSFLLKNTHANPGEYEVWNDIYDANIDCDLAIYGSSRAWRHVDPSIIELELKLSAYNFGMDGQNFWLQYLRHLKFIEYNFPPTTILLCVDTFSLDEPSGPYNRGQFLPYMFMDGQIFNYTHPNQDFHKLDYFVPILRFLNEPLQMFFTFNEIFSADNTIIFRNKGYRARTSEWNDDFLIAKSKMESYKAKIDPASKKLFERFIQECDSLDIQLILAYTPEYIDGQNFISNRSEIVEMFSNYARENDLIFLDYSSDSICLDKSNFYNSTHLNRRGATKFTKKLARDLKNLGI